MEIEKEPLTTLTKDDLLKYNYFETTKDLSFKEGFIFRKKNFIDKGTEFTIESIKDNKFEIHFESNKDNIYHNKLGDKYVFTFEEIKDFARPADSSIVQSLTGKDFVMKNWLLGHNDNHEPVYGDQKFTIRGYNQKTKELDIDIAEISIDDFIQEYKNGKIQECNVTDEAKYHNEDFEINSFPRDAYTQVNKPIPEEKDRVAHFEKLLEYNDALVVKTSIDNRIITKSPKVEGQYQVTLYGKLENGEPKVFAGDEQYLNKYEMAKGLSLLGEDNIKTLKLDEVQKISYELKEFFEENNISQSLRKDPEFHKLVNKMLDINEYIEFYEKAVTEGYFDGYTEEELFEFIELPKEIQKEKINKISEIIKKQKSLLNEYIEKYNIANQKVKDYMAAEKRQDKSMINKVNRQTQIN